MAGFRARARTVDMLGRQQIAGIPTAISELFKNAHDAYATRVEADYLRPEKMWILRDDGLGMTREDFEERWLVLGTDSKLGSRHGLKPPPTSGRKKRPVLGEKGIGRLAIASIGSQVLILTRARRGRQLSETTTALINWRLFELPGVNLEQITIPIIETNGGELPGRDELQAMAGEIREQLEDLELTRKDTTVINADLDRLDFSPAEILQYLKQPSLTGDGYGTQFIVVPTGEQIEADIDEVRSADGRTAAPPLIRTLIGFSDTMVPAVGPPVIETAFRDHRAPDDVVSLLGGDQFFTQQEFAAADHHVAGRFSRDGTFEGAIGVYGNEPEQVSRPYGPGGGAELACGPFRLDLAYVQGEVAQSRLDPVLYSEVTRKLDRIGGLYVYRDGIRVLPYGTPDFDFLGFEQRRSYNAGRYFFSYRRMFGAISLTRDENSALHEKAGREGFRENRAYRELKELLVYFFVQLAADYFSVGAERESDFAKLREEVERRYERRRQLDERYKRERDRFAARVGQLIEAIGSDRPRQQADEVLSGLTASLDNIKPGPRAGDQILAAELEARRALDRARRQYRLSPPPGIALTGDQRRDFEFLAQEVEALEEGVWIESEQRIADGVSNTATRVEAEPDRQRRLVGLLEAEAEEGRAELTERARQLDTALAEAQQALAGLREQSVDVAEAKAQSIVTAANDTNLASADDSAFVSRRVELETQLADTLTEAQERLANTTVRLQRAVALSVNGDGEFSGDETAEILGEEVLELREQAERDFELAQLGMATQVISHELDASITSVRDGLRRLYAWADLNENLSEVYEDIRTSFEHLDGYLTLFTPLQRRMRRRRESLSGPKIERFLRRLFERRLEEDEIELKVTPKFRKWTAEGYRSALYPVLINLIDNATYWVRQKPGKRWIRLDADRQALIVADSGPGIPERDRARIWDFGFTRKPAGRGAGLHISRQVLERDGGVIGLIDAKAGEGATFRIELLSENAD